MHRLSALFCLAAILITIGGCSAVVAPQPIGTPVTKKDPINLTGVWKLQSKGQSPEFIYVTQQSQGQLQLAMVKYKKGQFKLEKMTGKITKNKGGYYINFRHKVSTIKNGKKQLKRQGYTFARIVLNDDNLIVFPVNAAYFKDNVQSGAIKGNVVKPVNSGYRIYLDLDKAALNNLITTDKAGKQFKIQQAIALSRVGCLNSKEKK